AEGEGWAEGNADRNVNVRRDEGTKRLSIDARSVDRGTEKYRPAALFARRRSSAVFETCRSGRVPRAKGYAGRAASAPTSTVQFIAELQSRVMLGGHRLRVNVAQ